MNYNNQMLEKIKYLFYNLLAVWYARKGDFVRAEKYTIKLLDKAKRQRNPRAQAILIGNLAFIYKEKKDYDKAIKLCEEALQYQITENEKFYLLHIAGESAYLKGDHIKTINYLNKAEELATQLGDIKSLIEIKNLIGLSYALIEDRQKAISYLEDSLKIAKSEKNIYYEAYINLYLANVYEKFIDETKAKEYYEESERIFKKIGLKKKLKNLQIQKI